MSEPVSVLHLIMTLPVWAIELMWASPAWLRLQPRFLRFQTQRFTTELFQHIMQCDESIRTSFRTWVILLQNGQCCHHLHWGYASWLSNSHFPTWALAKGQLSYSKRMIRSWLNDKMVDFLAINSPCRLKADISRRRFTQVLSHLREGIYARTP